MTTTVHLPPVPLSDAHQLPAIGLGTFGMTGDEGVRTVSAGIDAGYRMLDTASGYRNESEVGRALQQTPVPREQIYVTSKLRGPDHAYELARQSIRNSRARLGGEPIDLYLIHWPNRRKDLFVEAWRALIDAREAGDLRSIGVSNFERPHLERIIEATGEVPTVNQIELHPYFPQPELRALNADLGICTQSWSPIGLGRVLTEPAIMSLAPKSSRSRRHGWCCAGTTSWGASRSRGRPTPDVKPRTSTSQISLSPRTTWPDRPARPARRPQLRTAVGW